MIKINDEFHLIREKGDSFYQLYHTSCVDGYLFNITMDFNSKEIVNYCDKCRIKCPEDTFNRAKFIIGAM